MSPPSRVPPRLSPLSILLLLTPLAGCQTFSDVRAFQAIRQGSPQRAVRHFDRRVARYPDDPQSYRWRGVARLAVEDYEAAVSDFNRNLQLDPEDCEALTMRAVAFVKLGEFDRAISDCTTAIDVAPDAEKGELYKLRARIFSLMGDETRAQSDLAVSQQLTDAAEPETEPVKRPPRKFSFSFLHIPLPETSSVQ